jgi:hypothetical protein
MYIASILADSKYIEQRPPLDGQSQVSQWLPEKSLGMAEVSEPTFEGLDLVSIVKDCVDLFAMISPGRFGRDAEILDTKLDIEKMLLLQWAKRVNLVSQGAHDERLNKPEIQQEVEQVLLRIKNLLGESKALKESYGLRTLDSSTDAAHVAIATPNNGASASRTSQFLQDFANLNKEIGKTHSTAKKILWVVTNKVKFNNFIQELSYFISQLHNLVPGNTTTTFEMTQKDFSRFYSIPRLKLIIEAVSESQTSVTNAAKWAVQHLNQRRVLKRLWFRWMDERKMTVKEAHFKTLHWALDPPQGELKWDDLGLWLRQGSGIYWVAGKAGSGKSTLMKHLEGHPQTKQLLNQWAAGSDLILASFFFYGLSNDNEQKSYQGLLRGLLYQILEADPQLVESILPNMWQEAIATEDDANHDLAMPSMVEMQMALQKLSAAEAPKTFLLIDGLDEYDGPHKDVAEYFKKLSRASNMKILVSSRPLHPLVAAFSENPRMNLPDLTRTDIAAYIDDTISSHAHMKKTISVVNPELRSELIDDLIQKASGVFLWVVLACRSLLEGFDAFEDIQDLKARVDRLPDELAELFSHMMAKIEPRWREHAAKLLRLMFDNQTQDTVRPIPTMGLALSEEDDLRVDGYALLAYISEDQILAKCQMIEGRLRSRCSGLLEIQKASSSHNSCFCELSSRSRRLHNELIDSHVVFIHRSVYEFLCDPRTWDLHAMRIKDQTFNTNAAICSIWVRLAGLLPYFSVCLALIKRSFTFLTLRYLDVLS